MIPAVDAELERLFAFTNPAEHAAWWAWLTTTLGEDPSDLAIMTVTLGEGEVVLTRYEQPYRVLPGDEWAILTERRPAPTPPPCWPPMRFAT